MLLLSILKKEAAGQVIVTKKPYLSDNEDFEECAKMVDLIEGFANNASNVDPVVILDQLDFMEQRVVRLRGEPLLRPNCDNLINRINDLIVDMTCNRGVANDITTSTQQEMDEVEEILRQHLVINPIGTQQPTTTTTRSNVNHIRSPSPDFWEDEHPSLLRLCPEGRQSQFSRLVGGELIDTPQRGLQNIFRPVETAQPNNTRSQTVTRQSETTSRPFRAVAINIPTVPQPTTLTISCVPYTIEYGPYTLTANTHNPEPSNKPKSTPPSNKTSLNRPYRGPTANHRHT
jgi:hypothetical protein